MKLYLCSRDCPCGMFSVMLMRLKQQGIEPNIHDDDPEETFLEYDLPQEGLDFERQFNLDLFRSSEDSRRPCIICYGRGYRDAQVKFCESCGEQLFVCEHCHEQNRTTLAACPFCKAITQDRANAFNWKSKDIVEIIPEMLVGHDRGMNFARLAQNLEDVCGRELDRNEVLTALRHLVKSGVVKKKGPRRYGVDVSDV